MANDIQLKRSSVAGRVPNAANVLVGEPVINLNDKIIFTKDGAGNVIVIGAGTTSNVIEGSNLYFSNARVSTAISTQTLGNATFSSDVNVRGELFVTGAGGDEGGQITLAPAVTNSTLTGQVVIDVFQNKLRFFEKGGSNRGAYIDLSTGGASAGTSLISTGSGTITSVAGVSSGAVSNAQLATATVTSQTLTNATFSANVTAGNVSISSGGVLTFPDGTRQTTAASGSVSSVNGRTGAVTGLAETANALSQFASTTSSQLAGIISDETGTGSLVFASSPTLVTPVIGAATGTSLSLSGNIIVSTGNASGSGITLSDDGDIVDMNDGFASMRFISGVKVKTNKFSATDAITLASTGTLTATGNVNSAAELVTGALTAGTLQTAGNVNANNLRVVTNSSLGTVVQGTWNGASISTTYTDAKVTSVNGQTGAATGFATTANSLSQFASTTSAQLAGVISDETGSGALVFATTPTLVTPVLGLATGTSVMLSANVGAAAGNVSGNFTAGNFQTAGNVNAASALFTGAVTAGSFQTTGLITGNINLRTEGSDYARIYSDVVGATSNLVLDISDDVNSDAIVLRHTHFNFSPLALDMAVFRRKDNTNATIAFAGDLTVSANVNTGNILATGPLTASTIQSAGNVNVAAGLATGNFTAGNFQTAGNVNAASALFTGAVTAGTLQTSGNVNANNLRVVTNSSLGTVVSGTWNGASISTTYTDAKVTSVNGQTGAATGFATTANTLAQFASTTSAQLATLISDETGSGALVFATTPTLVTPVLGLATGTSVMLSANIGAAAGNVSGNFTAGNYQTAGNVNSASGLFTGSLTAGTLQTSGNVNASSLRVTTASSLGTVQSGTWNGSSISTTYTDAKVTTVAGSTGAISNAMILSALLTVDGASSGLDADLLDGQSSSYYLDTSSTAQTKTGNITLVGTLSATTKSFVIDHPTKPGMKLRYGSLEGPENGVYVRGNLKGSSVIDLPEYWVKLVDPESISIQLTPIGRHQKLFVEDIIDNSVIIGNDNLFAGEINCFYTIFAERVDVGKLQVEI